MLGALYESYVHPLTILSTLPFAAFGALLALRLTHTEFSLVTAIACILVVGMVMKNAILMVDAAIAGERAGLAAAAAIRHAACERLRPTAMTMAVAVLSALPLGIAIVGGLLVAQTLTLLTIPAVHVLVARLRGAEGHSSSVNPALSVTW